MGQDGSGGMWDRDKETRQSNSNAAYEGIEGRERNSWTAIASLAPLTNGKRLLELK